MFYHFSHPKWILKSLLIHEVEKNSTYAGKLRLSTDSDKDSLSLHEGVLGNFYFSKNVYLKPITCNTGKGKISRWFPEKYQWFTFTNSLLKKIIWEYSQADSFSNSMSRLEAIPNMVLHQILILEKFAWGTKLQVAFDLQNRKSWRIRWNLLK